MTRKRAPNGGGTLYREEVAGRRSRWVSEAHVNLHDGRRVRVRGRGATAEDAVMARLAKARALDDANPAVGRLTVRQLSDRWVEAGRRSWRASTVRSYRTSLDLHVLPVLGAAFVARVGALDAQRVLTRSLRSADPPPVAAANRARRVMHALFAFARESGLIHDNPIDGVRSVRVEAVERGWWTRGQSIAFLAAAARSPYRDLFHAAIVTGLRMGELLALRWTDVGAAGVTVRRTYSPHVPGRIQEAPKSSASRRTVPVPPSLLDRLEARRAHAGDLVFPSRMGEVLNPSNVNRALKRYAAAAEVPVLRFHDLRRTYASLLAEDGYHPKKIQRLLGHSTVDLALRVYTSVSDASLAVAVVDLDAAGGNIGGHADGPQRPSSALGVRLAAVDVAPDTMN